MKCVYVAGSYSADNVLQVFENMRKGIKMSSFLFQNGYAPFCPWLDYHFCLMKEDNDKLTVEMFYEYSIAWLLKSDALLVLPDSEQSKGTVGEIELAQLYDIPVFYSFEDMDYHFKIQQNGATREN